MAKVELRDYTYANYYIIEADINLALVFNKKTSILTGYNYVFPSDRALKNMGVSRITYIKSALPILHKKLRKPLTLENAQRHFKDLIEKYKSTYGKIKRSK
jgi:hypothetical protein